MAVSCLSQAPLGIQTAVMSAISFAAVYGVYELLPDEESMTPQTCAHLRALSSSLLKRLVLTPLWSSPPAATI